MEKSSKRGKIPQTDWPLIMARYEAGETLASIARTYDCSPPAISYIVSRSREQTGKRNAAGAGFRAATGQGSFRRVFDQWRYRIGRTKVEPAPPLAAEVSSAEPVPDRSGGEPAPTMTRGWPSPAVNGERQRPKLHLGSGNGNGHGNGHGQNAPGNGGAARSRRSRHPRLFPPAPRSNSVRQRARRKPRLCGAAPSRGRPASMAPRRATSRPGTQGRRRFDRPGVAQPGRWRHRRFPRGVRRGARRGYARRAGLGLREATDRLLRAGARTRIELERLEARVPLPPRDGGAAAEPAAWRHR